VKENVGPSNHRKPKAQRFTSSEVMGEKLDHLQVSNTQIYLTLIRANHQFFHIRWKNINPSGFQSTKTKLSNKHFSRNTVQCQKSSGWFLYSPVLHSLRLSTSTQTRIAKACRTTSIAENIQNKPVEPPSINNKNIKNWRH